jgi:hypothetical protein
VLSAFFDPEALEAWWQTRRSLAVPRPLGVYALEWAETAWRDEVLGRLGGVFHGIVVDHAPSREFFVANAYWIAPDGDPVGPMALSVTCVREGAGTRLRVRQSGHEDVPRWTRFYEVITPGWTVALQTLKQYLEKG